MDTFWTYHTKGDLRCDACVTPPTWCEACEGLVHTHLNVELDSVQAKCDQCGGRAVPPPEEDDAP
ncbi:hypothetical protein LCGC14_0289450 [marine sediment metagenome]|uniref:Uncharacterized protein n=1 Tax=marine sediment metagenome TaxID=412755 RepID=A0A0F9WZH8_9ZZZZ